MDEDNELMEYVKTGDRKAFDKLVLKHRNSAIRFAQKYVNDEYLAEDIVQDSFVAVYLNRNKYKSNYRFKTYIFTIVRNKSIDYLRKQKNVSLNEVELKSPSTEKLFLEDEERTRLNKCLNSLTDEYKRVLYLYEFEEMSYKDIAKVMRKTLPQIKITIYRARKKLKSIIRMEESEC